MRGHIDPARFDTFLGVLDQVKQVGYAGFETGFLNLRPYFNSPSRLAPASPVAASPFLASIYFSLPNAGIPPRTCLLPPCIKRWPMAELRLGAQRLIFSGAPANSHGRFETKDRRPEPVGAFRKSAGLPLAYHNRWWEFQSKVGEIEALYAETIPRGILLLDAGHAYRGGADVPAFCANTIYASSRCTCATTRMASRFLWEAAPFLLPRSRQR